jgi:transposase-like protein
MSKRTRRHHTAEQKAIVLKRHLVDKVPVSDLCDENGLQPSLFYTWQRQLFENAGAVFEGSRRAPSREHELEAKIAQLEAKLARKDAVIAEISEEYVQLKKELGEP